MEVLDPTSSTPGYFQSLPDGDVTPISVQAFTPILGTLLLSPNGMVSGPARCAVVEMLGRIRGADDAEDWGVENSQCPGMPIGLFAKPQRKMFEDEILLQLVIGIGRLDVSTEEDATEVWFDASARTPAAELPDQVVIDVNQTPNSSVNSYFPTPHSSPTPTVSTPLPNSTTSVEVPMVSIIPPSPPPGLLPLPEYPTSEPPSPISSISYLCGSEGPSSNKMGSLQTSGPVPVHPLEHATLHQEAESDVNSNEQAAIGRLSSMSLIAAVTAGGASVSLVLAELT